MEGSPLDVLPDEIKVNIFSRLPVESVLDCKLVCRAWSRDLLRFRTSTTYFANLHLRYQYSHRVLAQLQQQKPFERYYYGFDSDTISFVGFQTNTPRDLWYLEYYDVGNSTENRPNYCMRKMNLELPAGVGGLAGSVNGLICVTAKTKYKGIPIPLNSDGLGEYIFLTYTANQPLYICNPVTREFVNLPGILIDEKESINGVYVAFGFGYHPITNQYKVVRICYVGKPGKPSFNLKGRVEVYTIGGSGWRSLGETDYFLRSRYNQSGDPAGFSVNGALHWFCNDTMDIVVFDLADEKFHLLRAPITRFPVTGFSRRKLNVMRGCLCLEYWYSPSMELWVLKKNKVENSGSSSTSYHMIKEQYYKSWSWSREFILSSTPNRWRILSLLKRGEVLLNDHQIVIRCNSNQGPDSSKEIMAHNHMFDYWNPLHINSFVSLEALGESNVMSLEFRRQTTKYLLQARVKQYDCRTFKK